MGAIISTRVTFSLNEAKSSMPPWLEVLTIKSLKMAIKVNTN